MKLTVIVPFYNEEQYLEQSVNRLTKHKIFSQIILADDGSTDNSSKIAQNLELTTKNIKYIKSNLNGGKGSILDLSRKLVNTSHVIVHDADMEYFPEDIVEMFKLVLKNPETMILGTRFNGNLPRKNIYLRTYYGNIILSMFFSLVHYFRISDVATCYKLMPSKFFKDLKLTEKGFGVEIEILSKYLNYSRSVIEVPIKYEGRTYSDGKKIKLSDGFRYLFLTLKFRLKSLFDFR
jgi:dolichol-phosphate mannosyltransferase